MSVNDHTDAMIAGQLKPGADFRPELRAIGPCEYGLISVFVRALTSVTERPENCVLTPARARLANIFNGNFYGADADASLYRNASS